ncbi:MAG: ABC transporter permease [Candidatus Poribacteria bacterium]|nr:ABC transporter permease [Candidatus Poribacteria bacterium]
MSDLQDAQPAPTRSSPIRVFFTRFGERTIDIVGNVGATFSLLFLTLRLIFARPFFVKNLMQQLAKVGVQSLPVVVVTGTFVGMVLALQGYHNLKELGSEGLLGSFVATSSVKELGAVLVGFVLSGRIGASITAELGTMKVTEQIDAIEAMGASPIQYLVVPRFLACVMMLPVLATFANILAVIGGYVLATNFLQMPGGQTGMNGEFYWAMVSSVGSYKVEDVITSLFKSTTFGAIIATIGCYMGFSISPASGAEGVGKATTTCAVMCLVLILIATFTIEFVNREVLGL